MRDIFRVLLTGAVIALLTGCGNRENASKDDRYTEAVKRNSVYYWKTVFDIDSTAMSFIEKHDIGRIYLRMFDVATEPDFLNGNFEIVPIATTKFASSVPNNLEIVPVTYITIDALRAMAGREAEFASLIVERLLAMSSYNECGKINEIQLDCDWTSTTKNSYCKLCGIVKDSLSSKGMDLSITVRLHQLQETPPPADRGVLMLYNTGALKSTETQNSILCIDDVKPYIKQKKYAIPLDYAYPVFGWGVKFWNNKFVSIVPYDNKDRKIPEAESADGNTDQRVCHIKYLRIPAVTCHKSFDFRAVRRTLRQMHTEEHPLGILPFRSVDRIKNTYDHKIGHCEYAKHEHRLHPHLRKCILAQLQEIFPFQSPQFRLGAQ